MKREIIVISTALLFLFQAPVKGDPFCQPVAFRKERSFGESLKYIHEK
jgi:hypothetical protein